jgi:hypothetical protein
VIVTLLRQDPAARNLPIYAVAGVVAGFFLRGLAASLPEDLSLLSSNARGWMTFTAALGWFTCLQLVLAVNFMTRSSRMALALPLRSRTVWWTRMVSLLYTGTVPILVATVVVALRFPLGGGLSVEPLYLLIGGKAWAGVILATALFQSPWPSLQRIRPGVGFVVYVVFIALIVLLMVIVLPPHPVTILVMLALAAGLLVRLHLTVPEAFLTALTEPEEPDWKPAAAAPSLSPPSAEEAGAPAGTVRGARPEIRPGSSPLELEGEIGERWITSWTLFRLLVNNWQTWLLVPLVGFYALLLSDSYYNGRDPFPNLLFITIWPMILTYQGIIRLHRVDHLPLRRRTVLPYIVLPGLLSVLVGILLGTVLILPKQGARCQVCYGEDELQVAPEYWEIAWDGKVPEIGSPWGETLRPTAWPVLPGSPVAVYLPYETSEESSPRFLALQANRAVEAVHGSTPYSEEEIAFDPENPLVVSMSRREEYARGFPVEGSIDRSAPAKLRAWLLGGLALGGLWSLLTFLLVLHQCPSPFRMVYKVLYLAVMIVWGGALIVYILADLLGWFDPIMSARFFYVMLRQLAEAVPLGSGALVLLNFLGLGLGYLLVQAAFGRLEAPLGKVKPVWKEYG